MFAARDQVVVVLADGAGGTGDGARAAETTLAAVETAASGAFDATALLSQLDGELAHVGQSTAVVLTVTRDRVYGASVGDSEAWIVRAGDTIELSAGQYRKPLIGAGCIPIAIDAAALDGTLVVASDGLFRYAKRDDIMRIASGADLDVAARALIDGVRLPTGALQDDVAVVLVRPRASMPH